MDLEKLNNVVFSKLFPENNFSNGVGSLDFFELLLVAVVGKLNLLSKDFFIDILKRDRFIPFYITHVGNIDRWIAQISPNFTTLPIERIPNGVFSLESFDLEPDTGDFTNKYARGRFIEIDENGHMKPFFAQFMRIPLTYSQDIVLKCTTLHEVSLIKRFILDIFYKQKVVRFDYMGVSIPTILIFSDSISVESPTDNEDLEGREFKLTINLTIETQYPSIDLRTKEGEENKMIDVTSTYKF